MGQERVVGGRRYLICSDGLTDMVDLDRMEACMNPSDDTTVTRLYEAAMQAGGQDNVSIILVRIEPGEAAASNAEN
jgi:serine/threonine protein phosphatase PrpC